jgi:glutathione S-transferase
MDLYFSPMACSMATRIALYEAGASATFIEVDPRTKQTPAGDDFRQVNPLGLVPTLRTDGGDVLTENAAILQYVAARSPAADLAPDDPDERARLHRWLSFIGTELHKAVFALLFDRSAPDDVRAYALAKAPARLAVIDAHLADREFVLDHFSVADAYLVTVLGWTAATPIDLTRWPHLQAYAERIRTRPAVARAITEELLLYRAELARHREASPPAR